MSPELILGVVAAVLAAGALFFAFRAERTAHAVGVAAPTPTYLAVAKQGRRLG